jgi:tyramine---L-glutamate ligase
LQNKPIKKIFVCEFITGGGFNHADLPKSLAKEGALMRDALLKDLRELPIEIVTTIDVRVNKDALGANIHAVCRPIAQDENAWDIWAQLIETCDAVLVIAPETDGILHKFAQLTHDLGKVWLGCRLDAIEICGDKLKTYDFLHANNVPVPTFTLDTFLAYEKQYPNSLFMHNNRYVAKPRFGAGCEDTKVFADIENLLKFMKHNRIKSHIIQSFIEGKHASLTMLCKNGQAWLLSVNQQLLMEKNGQLQFNGVVVNGYAQYWDGFENIANLLASWMPGLNGLVGVDVVIGKKYDKDILCAIEINPRLTTSYVGLANSIGQNPAKLLLDCWQNDDFSLPKLAQKKVEIRV